LLNTVILTIATGVIYFSFHLTQENAVFIDAHLKKNCSTNNEQQYAAKLLPDALIWFKNFPPRRRILRINKRNIADMSEELRRGVTYSINQLPWIRNPRGGPKNIDHRVENKEGKENHARGRIASNMKYRLKFKSQVQV